MRFLSIAVMLIFLLAVTGCQNPATPDFNAALNDHLSTIADRNLEAFTQTLTSQNDLYVIFPNGAALTSTDAVKTFHREWFADNQWQFEPEIIKTIVSTDMATALLRYDYRDTPDDQPRSSWLVLVFQLEDDTWKLVHDQNTRIEPPRAATLD